MKIYMFDLNFFSTQIRNICIKYLSTKIQCEITNPTALCTTSYLSINYTLCIQGDLNNLRSVTLKHVLRNRKKRMFAARKQIVTSIPYAAVDIKFFPFCYCRFAYFVYNLRKILDASQLFVEFVGF